MTTANGYVKLYRDLLKWEWYSDINVKTVFIHCILNANFENTSWQGIEIKRGQFNTSFRLLSTETNLSIKKIRTAIKKLVKTKEIEIKTTNKYSIITVLNYDIYQNNDFIKDTQTAPQTVSQTDTQKANERQTKDNQKAIKGHINNNIRTKELNNNTKGEGGNPPTPTPKLSFSFPTFEEVKNFSISENLNVDYEKFYYQYDSTGWKLPKGGLITNWKSLIKKWDLENKKNGTAQKNGKAETKNLTKEEHLASFKRVFEK